MPCGGIFPLRDANGEPAHWALEYLDPSQRSHACFYCDKAEPPVTHFVEEWDAYLHRDCIDPFLATPEGEIVLKHGHEVIR